MFSLLGSENYLIVAPFLFAAISYLTICAFWGSYVVVQKRLTGWQAFKLGFQLITKKWFKCFSAIVLQALPFFISFLIMSIGVGLAYDQASLSAYYSVLGLGFMIAGVIGIIYFVPLFIVGMGVLYREIFGYKNPSQHKFVMTNDVS